MRDTNVLATHPLAYSRNGMSIFVLLLYSGYALGNVAVRFRSSRIPQANSTAPPPHRQPN